MNALGISTQPCDFFVYNAANQVYNGTTFVTWSDAAFTSYRVPATEIGTTGRFVAADVAGAALFELRLRGSTLAASPVICEEHVTAAPSTVAARVLASGQSLSSNGAFAELRETSGGSVWARYPVVTVNGTPTFGPLEVL